MKKLLKERLIKVVKTDVAKFNRYIKFSLSVNIEFSADLSYADLRVADLRAANLRSADLSSADLSYADLRVADLRAANLSSANLSYADLRVADLRAANLRSADLSYADLRAANLRSADLSYADLDMSCLSLSCKSLKFRSDLRIRTQIAFHFASLIKNADQENVTDEEKKIYADILDYVNRFHRTDVAKLEKL